MKLRQRTVAAFDDDGGRLFAAEIEMTGDGPVLRCTGRYEGPGGMPATPETLVTALHTLWQDQRFTAKAMAAAVPRAGAVHDQLELPPLRLKDLSLAAITALEDKVAFPPDEMCVGLSRARKDQPVNAVAARRHLVEERRAAIAAAGLSPAWIGLRPLAAAAAFWYGYGDELGDRPAILIELRSDESALILVRRGQVLFSRALPGLGAEGDTRLPELAAELRATYTILSTTPAWETPACLWLSGVWAGRPEIREALADLLGLEAGMLKIAKPFGLLRPATVTEPGPEMLVPVGLCLAATAVETMGPDLLPGLGVVEDVRHPWKTVFPAVVAILLFLGGLRLLAGAAAKQGAVDRAWLAGHEKEVEVLSGLQQESADLLARLQALEGYGGGGGAYLELLLALDGVLPPGTRVTRISLSGRHVDNLAGITPSVSAMLQRLKTHPLLARLELRGQAVSKTENGQIMEAFTLAGPFARESDRR